MYKIIILLLSFTSTGVLGFQNSYDPTQPLSGQATESMAKIASSGLVLQSIIKNSQGNTSKAIISGKIVSVGDTIAIFKVKSIANGKAVLSSPDAERTLTLFSQAVVNNK